MVIAVGEILFDLFEDHKQLGGAPFNFAFHLKQLVGDVRFVSAVGNDSFGSDIIKRVVDAGFKKEDIKVDNVHPTGTVEVELDHEGVPSYRIVEGVAYDFISFDTIQPLAEQSAKLLYIGSLAQRTAESYLNYQSILSQKGQTKVFYDLNLRPPHTNVEAVLASLKMCDLLKVNTEELEFLKDNLSRTNSDDDFVVWLIEQFSLELVVLTDGANESKIFTQNEIVVDSINRSIEIVDTVGAGDAYAAVVAAGYLYQVPIETVVSIAADFAANVCQFSGAIPEDLSVYTKLKEQLIG